MTACNSEMKSHYNKVVLGKQNQNLFSLQCIELEQKIAEFFNIFNISHLNI